MNQFQKRSICWSDVNLFVRQIFIFFVLSSHPVVSMMHKRLKITLSVTYAMCGSYLAIVSHH